MKIKKKTCCLFIIIVLTLSMGIGYAYLSSELNFEVATASISPYIRLCKRATTLHSETCTSSSTTGYCAAGGTSITYGQIGSSGTLTSGDAFDCDVNGDGTYDPATERFYYVTDLNSTTAILIFYTTTSSDGERSVGVRPPYDSSGVNYNGPITAAPVLPTKTAWPKATLYNNPAQIYNEAGGITVTYSTNTTTTHNLPQYKYTTAARLLTLPEFRMLPSNIFWEDFGGGQSFPNCLWLNTPWSTSPQVYVVYAAYKLNIGVYPSSPTNSCGVRPVIEVKKEDMLY